MSSAFGISDEEIVARYSEGLQVQFNSSARQRPESVVENRRRQHREEFDSTRVIAFWDGETLLDESNFQPTLCRDLSTNGLAFWVDQKPRDKYVAVRFDVNGEMVYLKARIAHSSPEFASGRPAFLVGCEFVGRLDWDLKLSP